MFYYILERNLKVESSLQHQLSALEKSINANSIDEEGLVGGQCSDHDMKVIMEAVKKLKESPLVSILQPKHIKDHDFWKFVDEPIIQDVSYA